MLLSFDWFNSAHFVALGETTFSEVATTRVSDNLAGFVVVFWVHGFDFLFNDLQTKVTALVRIKLKLTYSASLENQEFICQLYECLSGYEGWVGSYLWAVAVVSAAGFPLLLLAKHRRIFSSFGRLSGTLVFFCFLGRYLLLTFQIFIVLLICCVLGSRNEIELVMWGSGHDWFVLILW